MVMEVYNIILNGKRNRRAKRKKKKAIRET